MLGWIGMPCLNCNSKSLHMDNTINLAVCNVCGLIQANRIFAIFEAEGKTQIDFDNPELNLLLSEFSISKYKKDILENYNTILFTGKFGTYTLSERYLVISSSLSISFTDRSIKETSFFFQFFSFILLFAPLHKKYPTTRQRRL